MVVADRGQTRQGKRQGQAAKQPDPLLEQCKHHKNQGARRQGEPDARLCILDIVDGHAQPRQYGCHHRRFGRRSARPSGRWAFAS